MAGNRRMPREKATAALSALLERVCAGGAHADCVTAVYVFGSYVRGALTVGDVDVDIEYDARLKPGRRARDGRQPDDRAGLEHAVPQGAEAVPRAAGPVQQDRDDHRARCSTTSVVTRSIRRPFRSSALCSS